MDGKKILLKRDVNSAVEAGIKEPIVRSPICEINPIPHGLAATFQTKFTILCLKIRSELKRPRLVNLIVWMEKVRSLGKEDIFQANPFVSPFTFRLLEERKRKQFRFTEMSKTRGRRTKSVHGNT